VSISDPVPPDVQNILFDPQTSGGLLIFSQPDDAGKLLDDFHRAGIDAVEIGVAVPQAEHLLTVT
jgi:selenide,water dikinase